MSCSFARKPRENHGLVIGGKKHPLYKMREGIIYRCHGLKNPNHSMYNFYKNKGIRVCEEWLNSVKSFYDWAMSSGWKKGLVIDRIDSNGNYEPSNCRFITASENIKRARAEHDQRGENGTLAKLTNNNVLEIRNMLLEGMPQRSIAKIFNVSKFAIHSIKTGKTWKHI